MTGGLATGGHAPVLGCNTVTRHAPVIGCNACAVPRHAPVLGCNAVPHPPRIVPRPPRLVPRLHKLLLLLLAAMVQPTITALELTPASRLSEINLLASLQLHNTTFAGLEQKPGPHSSTPAAFFSGSSRAVYYSSQVRDNIMTLLKSSKEFSFLTSIRQTRHNSGTIFAFSYGKYQTNRYLEVEASGRQDVLRVHYSPLGGLFQQNNVESFPLRLADDSWHRLAVVISGDQIEVFLDCRSVHRRVVSPIDMTFEFPEQLRKDQGEMTLWLGQRNQDHALFKGYLQDTRLVAGHHGYLKQCPGTDSSCPTCGQFRELQDTVNQLKSYIEELSSRLEMAESRVRELEAKDCSKSCLVTGGGVMQHGETIEKGCEKCSCNEGKISCSPTECPPLTCANPVAPSNGSCCPTCKSSCKRSNVVYEHGESFSPRRCLTCKCIDGNIKCNRINPQRDCPKLDCPKEDTILEEGKCCSVCKVSDWCSRGHNCHEMADCQDGLFNYSCHCRNGFQGNGTHCEDINECDQLGDRNGHHCTFNNTQCVNTLGSYTCSCVSGFSWDSTNTSCVPLNLCTSSSPSHQCHPNATCEFLGPGKVACHCNQGFTGSGTDCQPVCSTPCHNGGTCVAPGKCACAPGFAGSHCQDDIDECLLGPEVHKCLGDAVCVNRPGWYYCACHAGYRSYHNPLDGATTCVDLDECATAVATCHHTATCINTLGSYSCYCGGKEHESCSTVCVVDGVHHNDGTSWQDGCNQCRCDSGRASCSQVECDCGEAGRDRGCCPQCYDKRTCPHQDIPGLKYSSGNKWIYRCQECECLRGEVDCWPVDCPPVHCSSPVRAPGSCCPVCPGDNATDCYNNDHSNSCVHAGMVYQEGDSWQLPYSDCTSCQCRVGNIYCTVEPSCGLVRLLDGSPYWQQHQLQLKTATRSPTSSTKATAASTAMPATSMEPLPAADTVFYENITIPQSLHDPLPHQWRGRLHNHQRRVLPRGHRGRGEEGGLREQNEGSPRVRNEGGPRGRIGGGSIKHFTELPSNELEGRSGFENRAKRSTFMQKSTVSDSSFSKGDIHYPGDPFRSTHTTTEHSTQQTKVSETVFPSSSRLYIEEQTRRSNQNSDIGDRNNGIFTKNIGDKNSGILTTDIGDKNNGILITDIGDKPGGILIMDTYIKNKGVFTTDISVKNNGILNANTVVKNNGIISTTNKKVEEEEVEFVTETLWLNDNN